MANVRVSQIGQTAVNRPVFEVMVDTRRYCFAVAENGRVYLKSRAWLFSLGVSSAVCNSYLDTMSDQDKRTLVLDSNNSADRADRFAAQTYGSGLAFVPDYSVFVGWAKLIPNGYTNFIL